MQKIKLIGISGTNGSGKDSLGEMLQERHGWLFVSGADLLREEARKRGLPIERAILRTISAEWRRKYGLGVLIDRAVDLFNESPGKYDGLVVSPMRNPGEAQHTKDIGGPLVWVDADPKVRYERIFKRQRSAEDNKTFEQFLNEEKTEMQHSGDEATLSLSGVKAKADIFLENNGDDIEKFKDDAEKALKDYI
jgi:dephospho-CoA kinase